MRRHQLVSRDVTTAKSGRGESPSEETSGVSTTRTRNVSGIGARDSEEIVSIGFETIFCSPAITLKA